MREVARSQPHGYTGMQVLIREVSHSGNQASALKLKGQILERIQVVVRSLKVYVGYPMISLTITEEWEM